MSPHYRKDTTAVAPGHRSVADSLSKGATISIRPATAVQGKGIATTSGAVIQRATIIVGTEKYTVNDTTSAHNFSVMFQDNMDAITRMSDALFVEGRPDLAAIVRPPSSSPPGFGSFFSSDPFSGSFFSSGSSFGRSPVDQSHSVGYRLPPPVTSIPSPGHDTTGGYSPFLSPGIWQPPSGGQSQIWGPPTGVSMSPFVPFVSPGSHQGTLPQERQPAPYTPVMRPLPTRISPPPDILSPAHRHTYEDLRARGFLGNTAEKDFAALPQQGVSALAKMLAALDSEDYKAFDEHAKEGTLAQVTVITDLIKASKNTMQRMADELSAKVATGMTELNKPGDENKGVHYAENYRIQYKRRWQESYRDGYTVSPLFDRIAPMDWILKDMASASDALDAWLAGLTIAECFTSLVALHYKAIKDQIGKAKFDARFGSTIKSVPVNDRLRINQSFDHNPLGTSFLKFTEDATLGDPVTRPNLNVGDWAYFYNHPKYLLKHPGGAVQGENAVYMGGGKYQGFGMSDLTEDAVLDWLADIYNAPRGYADYREILLYYTDKSKVSSIYQHWLEAGELAKLDTNKILDLYRNVIKGVNPLYLDGSFPNKIKKKDILEADEYTIGNVARKGGLTAPRKTIRVSAVQNINK